MTTYKEMFADFTSEHLLEKRALGDELSDEAHKAIEEIFAERGEELPPRPHRPVSISVSRASTGKSETYFRSAGLILLGLIVMGISKQLAHTWVGVLIALCLGVYALFERQRRSSLTPDERSAEKNEQLAEADGLNELMISAAGGDLVRVKELVSFGADVNARTISGTTALMYSVRNNHIPVVQFLLSASADVNATSIKASTANSIARKFGHVELAALLEKHGAR